MKQETISGPFQGTTFNVITLNRESNITCREKNHSQFHYDKLMYPELLIRIWMSSRRNASMITGISMGHETCQILGQVSHNLLYWKKNLQMGIHGPGSGWQRSKRHPGLITCGQAYGKTCQKQRNEKKKESWLSNNRSLTMPRRLRGIYFIDRAGAELLETFKIRGESLKFRCQQQCLCKSKGVKYWETFCTSGICKTNTHASLKPTNLRESVWKELHIKTTLQGRESIH